MTGSRRPLEIDENLIFQHREWRAQRIGWWALTGFVLAAMLGLFGGGPLSPARAGASDGAIRVEYQRFVRVGASTRLSLHYRVVRQEATAGPVLRMSRQYFDRVRLERVTPEPTAIEIGADDVALGFSTRAPATGPFTVVFDIEPLHMGRQTVTFRPEGGAGVTFTQFAYF